MAWTMVWMLVVLKIPVVAALLLIWWAVKEPEPEQGTGPGEGGPPRDPHPRLPRRPRPSRRGAHGDPRPGPPRRVRAVDARAHARG